MSDDKRANLSKYRLEKAKEDLRAAEELFKIELYKQSMNRSYYAIFHAIRALLALDEVDFKRHAGVIGYFQQHYIKTEIFAKEYSTMLTNASMKRNQSDYNDFFTATPSETAEQLENAKLFIRVVEKYLMSLST
jgi:uncharacterized protein (UPF0332 family)